MQLCVSEGGGGGPLFDLCAGSLHLSALKMMQIAAVCVINFIEELQKERERGGGAGEFNPCIQHGLYYKHKNLWYHKEKDYIIV